MSSRVPPEITVRRIASLGTLIAAMEMLSQPSKFEDGELLSAQIHHTHPGLARRFPRLTRGLASKRTGLALHAAQGAASAVTLCRPHRRSVRLSASAALAIVGAVNRMRSPFGADGADQFQQVVNVTLAATAALPKPEQARELAMRMLALEATIAYTASGLVKLVSPVWLKGTAFEGVIGTRTYGHPRLHRLVRRHPSVGRLVSWGTVAAETAFPLVWVLPTPAARAYLGAMTAFHLGVGQFMGLNRFLLAFGASHPALLYVISSRTPSSPAGSTSAACPRRP